MLLKFQEFLNEAEATPKDVSEIVGNNTERTRGRFTKSIAMAEKFVDVDKGLNEFKKWATTDYVKKNFQNCKSGIKGKEAAIEVMNNIIEISRNLINDRSSFSKMASKLATEGMVRNALKNTNWDWLVNEIDHITNDSMSQIIYHMTDDENLRTKVSRWGEDFYKQLSTVETEKLKNEIGKMALSIV